MVKLPMSDEPRKLREKASDAGNPSYPAGAYGAEDLIYVPQFKGDYAACLKEEKRKIYYYPLLPEALNRSVRLLRPPGNKNDS
ncbi:MAG: hypothetical protein GVY26_00245 [Bacteroidetes bacterium]|jgi:hypothetical protein|nr:hypothetical protein [Bacteroidota bacterium]